MTDVVDHMVVRRFRGHGGLTLVGHCHGDPEAQPVLLLHGGGQTRHSWDATGASLAERGFYAVSLDLRGHGDSEWASDGDYTMEAYRDDVIALADQFERLPALVGASLGGISSLLAVGDADGDVAAALVLVDIATRMEESGVDRIMGFMRAYPEGFADLEEAADAIAEYMPHRPRPKSTKGLEKNLRRHDDGRWRWHWDPQFMGIDRRNSASRNPDRMDDAARRVRCPALLVRGQRSELITQEAVEVFLSLVPHAEYVDVAEAGHMVAGDKNDIFTEAVASFLVRRLAPTE